MTASFASVAHGSNDIANALAPLVGVYTIWKDGSINTSVSSPVPTWALAYTALALDIGLALCKFHYNWKHHSNSLSPNRWLQNYA